MAFRVGERVVCVDDVDNIPEGAVLRDHITGGITQAFGSLDGLKRGTVYTVRALGVSWSDGGPAIFLVEIGPRLDGCGRDTPYRASRFRPLIERKTSTGFEILDDIRKRESVDETTRAPRRATV